MTIAAQRPTESKTDRFLMGLMFIFHFFARAWTKVSNRIQRTGWQPRQYGCQIVNRETCLTLLSWVTRSR